MAPFGTITMTFPAASNMLVWLTPIEHLLLAQAKGPSDFWLTKWMTPIWFLGVGIAIGVIALMLVMLLLRLLSSITPWSNLSSSPAGHWVALVVSAVIAAVAWLVISNNFPVDQVPDANEQLLIFLATTIISAITGWALVFCSSRQASINSLNTLTEGAAGYIGLSVLVVMLIGLLSTPLVDQPLRSLQSIQRLFQTGREIITQTIPAAAPGQQAPFVPIEFEPDKTLLESLVIKTDRRILLADAALTRDFNTAPRRVEANESLAWDRKSKDPSPLPSTEGRRLHIQNNEIDPATVEFTIVTAPPVPEARSILITAAIVLFIGLTILMQQAVAPRASAVALATIKNELAQPLFTVLMLLGAVAIVLFVFLSFNTFGEDIKLLKDCGITVIMLLAAFQGIWSASSSISEEIEGRTALTVLSKPIQRRSFVIGKFLGIFWVLVLIFIVLGTIELGAVAYKPIYEARETSNEPPTWQVCHMEMVRTVPGLLLGLMQATVLSAISVALATRLPQLANIAVCFGVYIVGHLATALVSSTITGFEIVRFVAQLVSTIVPILEHFSMQAAIDAGNPIPISLLCATLVYCLLYIMLSMFLALLLFEDRDLA